VRSDYTGGRTEDTIVNWIKKKTGPPSEQITGDQLAVKKGNVKKAVVYIGPLEGDLYNIHIATAKNPTLADSFEFYHTSDAVGADYGLTGAGVIVLRNFDERVLAYPGPTKQGPLIEFIAKNAKPALGIWQEVMYDVARGKPAMMLIMPNYDRKLHLQFHDIAKKLKGLIEFVTLDLKSLEEHQET
jgi:protein disulfide-isomerase A1